jgi:lipopolysaccharide export system permease protein
MTVLGRMLTRMVLLRFVFVLLGVSVFVLTLDIVTYAREILDLGGFEMVARYALYRTPGIVSTFLPISVLLALLLTLTELSYRNETQPLWASGVSPFRIMLMLAPLGLLIGLGYFALIDRAVPAAAPQLREWAIGDYGEKRLKLGEKDPIWMRAGPDILRAASADAEATNLEGVTIFRRDANGLLREQIMAASARLDQGRWQLHDVVVYYRDNLPPSRLDDLIYSGETRPAAAGARSGDPEEMTFADLSYFVDNSGFGIRPTAVYETSWHKRLTLPLTALVMIALCIPLAVRFRRGGGIGFLFAAGVGLGFVFFIIDGIAMTMGELGFVSPILAAWGPLALFALIATAGAFRTETV